MILDAHTHIGKKMVIGSAADLVKSMDVAGIDKSLVFAGKMNDQATSILLDDITPFADRLVAIGSVSPAMFYDMGSSFLNREENKRQLLHHEELLAADKIHGLKFYVGYEHFYPADQVIRPFLELLVKYNRPAIFHSGDCFSGACGAKLKYAHPLHIDDLAVDMPELKIVIAHLGYPFVREAAEVCYKNANVYTDTSGFVYGDFTADDIWKYEKVVKEFIEIAGGSKKIIFGSDWPISAQKSYVKAIKSTFVYRLWQNKEEMKQIMGLRAAELFGVSV